MSCNVLPLTRVYMDEREKTYITFEKGERIMKKTCLLMSMILLTTSLAGCGGATKDSAGTTAAAAEKAAAMTEAATAQTAAEEYYTDKNQLPSYSGEQYLDIAENRMVSTAEESMLTFSLKVDTAAYSNVERFIENGQLPPKEAVRRRN